MQSRTKHVHEVYMESSYKIKTYQFGSLASLDYHGSFRRIILSLIVSGNISI